MPTHGVDCRTRARQLPVLLVSSLLAPHQTAQEMLHWQDQRDAVREHHRVVVCAAGDEAMASALEPGVFTATIATEAVITRRAVDGESVRLRGLRRVSVIATERRDGVLVATVEPWVESLPSDAVVRRLRGRLRAAQKEVGFDIPRLDRVDADDTDVVRLITTICGLLGPSESITGQDLTELATQATNALERRRARRRRQRRRDRAQAATSGGASSRDTAVGATARSLAEMREDPELAQLTDVQQAALVTRAGGNHWDSVEDDMLRYGRLIPKEPQAVPAVELVEVRATLDRDVAGDEAFAERVLDWVRQDTHRASRKLPARGHALLLLGPPGVGKTIRGRAIATATQRAYVRIQAGSPHDGIRLFGVSPSWKRAAPGELVHSLIRAKTLVPVIQIDDVNQLLLGERGAASLAALLGLLDPEQSAGFRDAFLDFPIDLSRVIWVLTANTLETIHPALIDRCDVVYVRGYQEAEKLAILRSHLLPRLLGENGLPPGCLSLSDEAAAALVSRNAAEAGLRGAQRDLERLVVRHLSELAESTELRLDRDSVEAVFPPPAPVLMLACDDLPVGSAAMAMITGLGGGATPIQVVLTEGPGDPVITGQVSADFGETVLTAVGWLRSHAAEVGVDRELLERARIHVHLPMASVPKHGSSGGLAIACALVSACLQRPLQPGWVLTGEIDLLGNVLEVGSEREKVRAARAAGLRPLIPAAGASEVEGVDTVETVMQTLRIVGLLPRARRRRAPITQRTE
ncbi:MAG: S16 family serine protease [Candidatus Dormibacteria bacterium]